VASQWMPDAVIVDPEVFGYCLRTFIPDERYD
jgi:hypothetical protein